MRRSSVLTHHIAGRDRGGGPLLLANGVAMTMASWQPISDRLEKDHRVLRCDLRGQLTSPGRPPHDIADHAIDLVELLDSCGLDGVHVLATSFGAAVSAILAVRYPKRVRSLALVAATSGFDEGMGVEIDRWRAACLESLAGPDRGHLIDVLDPVVYSPAYLRMNAAERSLRRDQVSALPDSWFEGLADLLTSAAWATVEVDLATIECPTLVVAAELDGFIPLDRTRALADAIPNSRFEVMPGAGHAVVVEQPEELTELYLDFLSRID